MSGATASPVVRGTSQSTGPSPAAAPKQLFEAAYRYALVATRSRSPAEGGALAICLPSTGGMAAVVGVGAGAPIDAAGWTEGSVLTLSRTTYSTLVRDWVVIAGGVAGGTVSAGAQLPAAGGQRLMQVCRPPSAPSDADIAFCDAQRPRLACSVADAEREAVGIEMPLAVYLGRLDPNYVAARWRSATAAGAQSGVTPLGSAPRLAVTEEQAGLVMMLGQPLPPIVALTAALRGVPTLQVADVADPSADGPTAAAAANVALGELFDDLDNSSLQSQLEDALLEDGLFELGSTGAHTRRRERRSR